MSAGLDVVTGAFSYTGRGIAERLLAGGRRVRTLTRRAEPSDPLAASVEARPLHFADFPDAAGPEVLSFLELVRLTRRAVRGRSGIVHVRPALALAALVGRARGDVLLTREELAGLQRSLLVSAAAPTGTDRFSDWVERNADALGSSYVSELDRNFRPYAPL